MRTIVALAVSIALAGALFVVGDRRAPEPAASSFSTGTLMWGDEVFSRPEQLRDHGASFEAWKRNHPGVLVTAGESLTAAPGGGGSGSDGGGADPRFWAMSGGSAAVLLLLVSLRRRRAQALAAVAGDHGGMATPPVGARVTGLRPRRAHTADAVRRRVEAGLASVRRSTIRARGTATASAVPAAVRVRDGIAAGSRLAWALTRLVLRLARRLVTVLGVGIYGVVVIVVNRVRVSPGAAASRQPELAEARRARRGATSGARPPGSLDGAATARTRRLALRFGMARPAEPSIAVRRDDVRVDVPGVMEPSITAKFSPPAGTVAEPSATAKSPVDQPASAEQVAAPSAPELVDAEPLFPPVAAATDPAPEPAYEVCDVRWWRGYVRSEFFAWREPDADDQLAAHAGVLDVVSSPPFKWRRSVAPDRTADAVEAYEALVARLVADGWEYDGTEGEWYAARFRRAVASRR